MTSHAIRIHETGGPDVMKWEEVDVGDPGPGEIRIRHGAVGLLAGSAGTRNLPCPSGFTSAVSIGRR